VAAPFVEIVFRGRETEIAEVISDLGPELQNDKESIHFSLKLGLSADDRIYHLLAAFHIAEDHTHVLAPAETLKIFEEKLPTEKHPGVVVIAAHEVIDFSFRFTVDCYSRLHAQNIMDILGDQPKGLIIEGFKPYIELDPTASGVELYAPVHDFEFHGKGLVRGDVSRVIILYRNCEKEPLIKLEKMRIVLGADLMSTAGSL
jgi:hypothetical protein